MTADAAHFSRAPEEPQASPGLQCTGPGVAPNPRQCCQLPKLPRLDCTKTYKHWTHPGTSKNHQYDINGSMGLEWNKCSGIGHRLLWARMLEGTRRRRRCIGRISEAYRLQAGSVFPPNLASEPICSELLDLEHPQKRSL